MISTKLAKRYAKGLLGFTEEAGVTDVLFDEMNSLQSILKESNELQLFFKSPIIDKSKKISIGEEIFKGFSAQFKTFLNLVINHGREAGLLEISRQFTTNVQRSRGIFKASITTTQKLSTKALNSIATAAKKSIQFEGELDMEEKVDPSLIGGFVIRINDKEINTSIKAKLEKLKKEFSDNHYQAKF